MAERGDSAAVIRREIHATEPAGDVDVLGCGVDGEGQRLEPHGASRACATGRGARDALVRRIVDAASAVPAEGHDLAADVDQDAARDLDRAAAAAAAAGAVVLVIVDPGEGRVGVAVVSVGAPVDSALRRVVEARSTSTSSGSSAQIALGVEEPDHVSALRIGRLDAERGCITPRRDRRG